MEMQGGSGAEVSPRGWATTVTGANHDFDMILDWDAITFGFANQVWARLEFLSYYWQVVDASKTKFNRTEEGEPRSAANEARKDEANVRKVGQYENFRSVGREAEHQAEDLKKDRPSLEWYDASGTWTIKAGMLAIEGVSAVWDIGKAVVGAWLASRTSPRDTRRGTMCAPVRAPAAPAAQSGARPGALKPTAAWSFRSRRSPSPASRSPTATGRASP